MDQNERQIIDDLFTKLNQAEGQSGPRDAGAEALIGERVARQPAAPYYMAQAIVVQQDALGRAQSRIKELEQQAASRPSGGFLSGLFGGGQEAPAAPPQHAATQQPGRLAQAQGGGFLGGAMQTALGVAGGFLIADAISGLLSADDAAAAEPDAGPLEDPMAETERLAADTGIDDSGDFDAGGFDDF